MSETVNSNLTEKQVAEFQKRQLRDFKWQMNMELMLSRRERTAGGGL